jgi:hypothetical protein
MKLPSFRRKTSSLVSADTDRLIAAHGDGAYPVLLRDRVVDRSSLIPPGANGPTEPCGEAEGNALWLLNAGYIHGYIGRSPLKKRR